MITICKSCGYPVIPQMRTCPNCNVEVDKNEPSPSEGLTNFTCPYCGTEFSNNGEHYCPACGHLLIEEEDINPIIDSLAPDKRIIPVCTLSPITLVGEPQEQTHTFEDTGNGVQLSRANTMPSDASIDSNKQAVIWFDNGEWFVQDLRKDCRSTYVHAATGIKLTDGDIIRMGEREFKFNIKTE